MKAMLHFGSINPSPVHALRRVIAVGNARSLVAAVQQAIDDCLSYIGPEVSQALIPEGFKLTSWLDGGERPSSGALSNSVVNTTCAHLYHIIQLHLLKNANFRMTANRQSVSSIGHSIGLQSAVISSVIGDSLDVSHDLYKGSVRFIFMAALRACEEARKLYPLSVDALELSDTARASSPMLAVTNFDAAELNGLLEKSTLSRKFGRIAISILNSVDSCVLTGNPMDLDNFRKSIMATEGSAGVICTFLRSDAPFHSASLDGAFVKLLDDREFIGCYPIAAQLNHPVFDCSTGENLQNSDDLFSSVASSMIHRNLDWPLTVSTGVFHEYPESILDFGPSPAVKLLTEACLKSLGISSRFVTVATTIQ